MVLLYFHDLQIVPIIPKLLKYDIQNAFNTQSFTF